MPQKLRVEGETALTVARHEMGHFILARALGFKAESVAIEIFQRGGHRGECSLVLNQKIDSMADVRDFLERRAKILCGGVMAESMEKGHYDNTYACKAMMVGGGADQDYAKYREIIWLLRNVRYPLVDNQIVMHAQAAKIEREIWESASKAIEAEKELILGLSETVAGKVKYFDTRYEMIAAEFEKIPAYSRRFKTDGTPTAQD
jgi:hypothetical protein